MLIELDHTWAGEQSPKIDDLSHFLLAQFCHDRTVDSDEDGCGQ